MGFHKEAEERRDKARASNNTVIEELSEIVIHRCDGYKEWNNIGLKEALDHALAIRELIGG